MLLSTFAILWCEFVYIVRRGIFFYVHKKRVHKLRVVYD